MFGMGGDPNAPQRVVVPVYGPDAISRRLARFNNARANPASPRSWGIGVRPAPTGASFTEGTKTDGYLAPQQSFRGVTHPIAAPTNMFTKPVSSFPSANTQVNPVLLAMSQTQMAQRSWT